MGTVPPYLGPLKSKRPRLCKKALAYVSLRRTCTPALFPLEIDFFSNLLTKLEVQEVSGVRLGKDRKRVHVKITNNYK